MRPYRPEGRDAASNCEADGAKLRKGMFELGDRIRLESGASAEPAA